MNKLFQMVVFILPFFFLPITAEFYNFNKQALIFTTVIILLVHNLLVSVKSKRLILSFSSLDFYLLLFICSLWLSFFISSPTISSLTALFSPGTFTTLAILYFLLKNNNKVIISLKSLVIILLSSASLFAIFEILQLSGINKVIFNYFHLPNWLEDTFWSPLGVFTNVIVFLGIALALAGSTLWTHLKYNSTFKKPFKIDYLIKTFCLVFSLIVIITAFTWSINAFFKGQTRPFVLDQQNGWSVATANLRNFKTALFGIGPGNFPVAFTQNRPAAFSSINLSNITFPYQSNLYLEFLTEYGLISLVLFILLSFKLISLLFKDLNLNNQIIFFPLLAFFILSMLFYPSLMGLFYFFIFAAVATKSFSNGQNSIIIISLASLATKIILLLALSCCLLIAYFFGQFYLADMYYKKAIDSQTTKITTLTYQNIFQSNRLNPHNSTYRLFLSQISYSSARELMSKKELPEGDKTNLQNLLNQALAENRSAIALSPRNASLHFTLGQLYRDLTGINSNAASQAEGNYTNALSLDPNNSFYHFTLGSFYSELKEFALAQKQFELVIMIDPFYLNAYYNLYYVQRQQGFYEQALSTLSLIKNALPKENSQYQEIEKELRDFDDFVREATISAKQLPPSGLSTPSAEIKEGAKK